MTKIHYKPTRDGAYLLLITGRDANAEQDIWNKLHEARVRLSGISRSNQKPTEITVYPGENTDVLAAITAVGATPVQSVAAPATKPAAKPEVRRPRP